MDDNNLSHWTLQKLKFNFNSLQQRGQPSITEYYRGTTTSDWLLKNKHLELNLNRSGGGVSRHYYGFIVNTLHSNAPLGATGHWVAIVNEFRPHLKKVITRYFDSFGDSYKKYNAIANYIDKIRKLCQRHSIIFVLDVSTKPIQSSGSRVCGLYASYFITKAYETRNFLKLAEIFKTFKSNRKANDLKIIKYLRGNFPNDKCHMLPVYNTLKMPLNSLKKPPPLCPKKTLGLKTCFKNIKCGCADCC